MLRARAMRAWKPSAKRPDGQATPLVLSTFPSEAAPRATKRNDRCLVPPGSTCLQPPRSEKGEATREARGAQQNDRILRFLPGP